MLSAFIAKGDNGKWRPNYSTVGGDLGAVGIANLYYQVELWRWAGVRQLALGTAERIGAQSGSRVHPWKIYAQRWAHEVIS